MDKEFEAGYKQLNKAQKEAVDTIEGPVLVIAGPGTGKTQLLSLRVANILKLTDTDPSNILCLTFTNFAATNMRERLTKLVGPRAHNVAVNTFHSFAAEIMNQHQDYFWNGARLSVAPDAVQLEIIEDILTGLPLDNPLAMKFVGSFTALSDVQQALKLTKEAGLTPEKLQAIIDINIAYIDVIEPILAEILTPSLSIKKLDDLAESIDNLPDQKIDASISPLTSLSTVIKESLTYAITIDKESGKTTETGKWKKRWIQTNTGNKGMFDERKRNAWWQAVAPVYRLYRDTLHARSYYDYSDMLVEVISQLEKHPDLLSSIQEHYMYVMIDEFQDSNSAQLRLAHLVASNSINQSEPNLLAVGDDDQTIFAFNGAEIKNMLSFERTYSNTKFIVLEDNYRSTQEILDTASNIIQNADYRLVNQQPELSKDLKAINVNKHGSIKHLSYPTQNHELYEIAKQIENMRDKDAEQSIAVLSRSHRSLRELSAILNSDGIPISYEQSNNVLEHPLIIQLNLVAETIVAISEGDRLRVNHSLSTLLQHPVWGVEPIYLWEIAIHNTRDSDWLNYIVKAKNSNASNIANWLLWLSGQAATEPMSVIIDYIIGLRNGPEYSSPLRNYFIEQYLIDNTYLDGLSAIDTLIGVTVEFIASKSTYVRLNDYVRFINLHRELNRPITNESWFARGDNTVQLMTIHKSKGLEFDTVFVLDANEDNWKPRHIGRKPPANLPLQPYGEQYDDYVRLLYVAATRAKHSLIVSSYRTDGQGKELLATPLISHLTSEQVTTTKQEDIATLEATIAWPRLNSKDEKALLTPKLRDYHLNATAFLQFLDVTNGGPQQFLTRQLLRLPIATTDQMAYGTAIHKSLQYAQTLVNTNKFNPAKLIPIYTEALSIQQLPITDHERYLEHGKLIIESLFDNLQFKLKFGDQAEVSMRDTVLGSAKLSGMLDNVNTDNNSITITDYKTGKPLKSFETRDQTKAVKAWRHKSQLQFYTLLVKNSSKYKSIDQIYTRMLYVEADNQSELVLSYKPTSDDIDKLKVLISVVWDHIVNLNFPETSSYEQSIEGIHRFEQDLLEGKI